MIERKHNRILSILLSLFMFFSLCSTTLAISGENISNNYEFNQRETIPSELVESLREYYSNDLDEVIIDPNIDIYTDKIETVIVEFTTEPISVQRIFAEENNESFVVMNAQKSIDKSLDSFKLDLLRNGIDGRIKTSYSEVFNGVTLEIKGKDVPKLKELDGIRGVYPNVIYQVNPKEDSSLLVDEIPAHIGVNDIWENLGFQGKGIKIGIIDTGIDYKHPDLKDAYKGGYDFVDNDNDPFEGNAQIGTDHGTHVAGIIGGRGNPETGGMRGMAPQSDLYVYRVLDTKGTGRTEWVISAIEKAVIDGMDIINLSLGNTMNDSDFPTSRAVNNAMLVGVTTIVANGNDGPDIHTVGSPATGSLVIAVGSSTVPKETKTYNGTSFATPDTNYELLWFAGNEQTGINVFLEDKEIEYVDLGRVQDYNNKDVSGKIALIKRGTITFVEKIKNAKDRGAVAVIIFNFDWNTNYVDSFLGDGPDYLPTLNMRGTDGWKLAQAIMGFNPNNVDNAVVMSEQNRSDITKELGIKEEIVIEDVEEKVSDEEEFEIQYNAETQQEIIEQEVNEEVNKVLIINENLNTSNISSKPTFKVTVVTSRYNGDSIANTSSRGPVKDNLDVKPEIVAPGVGIKSTVPGHQFGNDYTKAYKTYSGTSMAAPHVAGIAALILEARPEFSPFDVKVALMNNAKVIGGNGQYRLFDMGAGRVQALKTIEAPVLARVKDLTRYTKSNSGSKLLEEVAHYTGILNYREIDLDKGLEKTIEIELRNLSKTPVTYKVDYSFLKQAVPTGVSLVFSDETITVPAEGEATLDVTLISNDGVAEGIYEGFVCFEAINGTDSNLNLPFIAYAGHTKAIKSAGMSPFFFSPNEGVATIQYDLISQTTEVAAYLYDYSIKWSLGYLFYNRNVPRGEHIFTWDGMYNDFNLWKKVPIKDGIYGIELAIYGGGTRPDDIKVIDFIVSNNAPLVKVDQAIANEIYIDENTLTGTVDSFLHSEFVQAYITKIGNTDVLTDVKYEIYKGSKFYRKGDVSYGNDGVFQLNNIIPGGESTLILYSSDVAGNKETYTYTIYNNSDTSSDDEPIEPAPPTPVPVEPIKPIVIEPQPKEEESSVSTEDVEKIDELPQPKQEELAKEQKFPQLKPHVKLTDIGGHWAEKNIMYLVDRGIINGYADGTFKPDKNITRAEFVTIIVKALDLATSKINSFSDIESHWAKDAISIAYANGIVKGFEDGSFKPNELITREQMATIVVNAFKLESKQSNKQFMDQSLISPWAKESISTIVEHGIFSGYQDGTLKPKGSATRAEAVTVIKRALEKK